MVNGNNDLGIKKYGPKDLFDSKNRIHNKGVYSLPLYARSGLGIYWTGARRARGVIAFSKTHSHPQAEALILPPLSGLDNILVPEDYFPVPHFIDPDFPHGKYLSGSFGRVRFENFSSRNGSYFGDDYFDIFDQSYGISHIYVGRQSSLGNFCLNGFILFSAAFSVDHVSTKQGLFEEGELASEIDYGMIIVKKT